MADLTPNEAIVLRALQDAPPWWPAASPTALLSIIHGAGERRVSSVEAVSRALNGLKRKGVATRDKAGWRLASTSTPERGSDDA